MNGESTNSHSAKAGLVFKSAPVVFTSCRAAIDPPIPITIGFIDAFRRSFGPADLEVLAGVPIEAAPGKATPEQYGPIAAVAMVIQPTGIQVVIQSDVVIARWMRTPGGTTYPGFKNIAQTLQSVVEALQALVPEIQTPVAHVVYLDMLYDPELTANQILARYFNERLTMPVWKEAKDLPTLNINWVKQDDINFRITFHGNPAPLMIEDVEPINVRLIEWSALCSTGVDEDLSGVMDRLHRSIHETFMDVISEDAKREWGYENG